MQRCLQLAQNGLGRTYPNPLVGSVIVLNDKIIGEGWHQKAGKPHAEVNALNSIPAEIDLKKASLYVNLEPCSHYGKTPPCSDLIIKKGIKKVIIGTLDPNPKVAGKGVDKMIKAGIDVKIGCLEKECSRLNARFFTFQNQKRPYVILKWAQTQDGFIAPKEQAAGKPVWITNPYAKQLVHKWRSEEQAILVGKNTALKDNPQLNTRLWEGKSPVRLLIDRHLESEKQNLHLFDRQYKTIVFCEHPKEDEKNIIFESLDFDRDRLPQILKILYRHNIQSLIVEGGQITLQHFIDAGLWDEARVFTGMGYFEKGVAAPVFSYHSFEKHCMKDDVLTLYYNN